MLGVERLCEGSSKIILTPVFDFARLTIKPNLGIALINSIKVFEYQIDKLPLLIELLHLSCVDLLIIIIMKQFIKSDCII